MLSTGRCCKASPFQGEHPTAVRSPKALDIFASGVLPPRFVRRILRSWMTERNLNLVPADDTFLAIAIALNLYHRLGLRAATHKR